ncbi:4-alpha-glucanotransferase [Foetidibacter luteolus]|uniref:4-alpha-glucanotransferase n=1 Tax=Foetidibacter luteolus TaxID=2608880 RepID=UPI001F2D6623|nr:4-alpha-glucanotransferase [Foetidibacter luteolus]
MATEKNTPATEQAPAVTAETTVNGLPVPAPKKAAAKKAKKTGDDVVAETDKTTKEKTAKKVAAKKAAKPVAKPKKAEIKQEEAPAPLPDIILPVQVTPEKEETTAKEEAPVKKAARAKKAAVKEPTAKAPAKKTGKKATPEAEAPAEIPAAKPKKAAAKPKKAATVATPVAEENIPFTETIAETAEPATAPPVAETEPAPQAPATVKLVMHLRFHTEHGQHLFITGNHEIFGNEDISKALPMHYVHNDLWAVDTELDISSMPEKGITYNHVLRYPDGIVSYDWGSDKVLKADLITGNSIHISDAWNHAGFYENAFYTEPFTNVLLKDNYTAVAPTETVGATHLLKVKAPLLTKGQTICITGAAESLGNWKKDAPVLLSRKENEDEFTVRVDLSKAHFPVKYKYAVYDVEEKKIVRYEDGADRFLQASPVQTSFSIINDGFAVLPNNTWKGAGVSVPVFSLRSKNAFGCGEFTDLKLLVDWAKKTGLKLIQILPVNDTTATHSWVDSYPYAAISAFALHPMYLNLAKVAGEKGKHLVTALEDERLRINKAGAVDYEAVNSLKWKLVQQLYPLLKDETFASEDYQAYFEKNKHWLTPYAAFCYLRDKYATVDFNKWPQYNSYNAQEIAGLASQNEDATGLHYFIQYHLHLQLKEAADYAHANGIILKGDIAIGVYRYGADAWQQPGLYHMDMQAGAPPDDFAPKGQNWGFPTYNWEKMKHDGFAWWRQRFEQMSYYFDAFRIDHILGFFRIWSIPYHSVEGIMGHFEPAIPVSVHEFHARGIAFDFNRYTRPYITDKILNDTFGDQQDYIRRTYLLKDGSGNYLLKPEFSTQRQIENYFGGFEKNAHNAWLKQSLFNIISNVILFEAEGSDGQLFHFRFSMENTLSFRQLDGHTQNQLKDLYVNYFFRRQDNFWKVEAMQKLPGLKRVTNMLVCGEDLGLVPGCVHDVMKQLGILSLEIQRMPKDSHKEFFHPADAPYLSVVTPSTHDMSTIRSWWEEDRNKSQRFYNTVMGQKGYAPYLCDAWVNKAIVEQHLFSPAMWSIFQVQDLLGINQKIRKEEPHDERINVPANPKNYWRYRVHLNLEDLLNAEEFNTELQDAVTRSGRG